MGSDDCQVWHVVHDGVTFDIDGVTGDTYAGYICERSPGDLLGAFVWVDRSDDRSFVNPDTTGILPTRNLLATSNDGGATWELLGEVDLGPETGCTITGPVFAAGEGRLGLPYESWKDWHDESPGTHAAMIRWSADFRDWSDRSTVATDPGTRLLFWDQRIATHPDTGELVAMFWTHDRASGLDIGNHICWSSGAGGLWSRPIPTGWSGQHCQPLSLGGGRLAAISVRRENPGGIEARISEDFGRSWGEDVLRLYDAPAQPDITSASFEAFWQSMMTWQFGHPRAVLTPDGEILAVWYASAMEGGTNVMWARVEL